MAIGALVVLTLLLILAFIGDVRRARNAARKGD